MSNPPFDSAPAQTAARIAALDRYFQQNVSRSDEFICGIGIAVPAIARR
jgi:hypothetical protein